MDALDLLTRLVLLNMQVQADQRECQRYRLCPAVRALSGEGIHDMLMEESSIAMCEAIRAQFVILLQLRVVVIHRMPSHVRYAGNVLSRACPAVWIRTHACCCGRLTETSEDQIRHGFEGAQVCRGQTGE